MGQSTLTKQSYPDKFLVSVLPWLCYRNAEINQNGTDFQILAVAVPYDPLPTVHEYAKQHALPFDVIFDEQKNITSSFAKKDLYPTSVLVNKRGEVLKTFVGEPNFNELYQTVDLELAK